MPVNNEVIKIEPSILIWARESLGMSIAEVANKLDKDRDTVKQWEIGKTTPSLAQLEKLAYNIYKRPLAVFFLPRPPKESTAKQDFRTLPDKEISNLSPELRLIVRRAKYNQFVLKEINKGKNPLSKPLHKEFKFRLSNNPTKTANNIREYLGINRRLQANFKNSEFAFNYFRNLIENNGIFIFQYPLPEARGFSLMDEEFPVIVLNSGDSPNGKIFSLIHELCHILFNTGGVFRDFQTGELKGNVNNIERFCNQFASDFILPNDELLNERLIIENKNSKEWNDEVLQEIASIYKVSKEVVLRKLLQNNLTTQTFYLKARAKWNAQYKKFLEEKKLKQKGGPTYHTTNISHLGKNFILKVLTSYHNGVLTAPQVADFLNIKISRIKEYEQKIF